MRTNNKNIKNKDFIKEKEHLINFEMDINEFNHSNESTSNKEEKH